MIDHILNNNPAQYSMSAIEHMLRNPENMVLDEDGKLWLVFIHDSKCIMNREVWMIHATPVAMAVYMGLYSVVEKLLDMDYNYEPLERFRAYNVEGDIDKMAEKEGMVLVSGTYYRTIRYNDVTNIQLITCMTDSPKWILGGIWKEAEHIPKGELVFEDIFYNIKRYHLYSVPLIKDNTAESIYTDVTTKCNTEPDTVTNISQLYRECIDRISKQLLRKFNGEYKGVKNFLLVEHYEY